MSRLYRLAVSGKLPTNELTQLVYSLKEIRNAIEAEREAAALNIVMTASFGELTCLSVPRGSLVDVKTGVCTTPAGEPISELRPCEPYPGTPPLNLFIADHSQAIEPMPVHEVPDDGKITRLDSWKRDEPGTA